MLRDMKNQLLWEVAQRGTWMGWSSPSRCEASMDTQPRVNAHKFQWSMLIKAQKSHYFSIPEEFVMEYNNVHGI